MYVRVCAYIHVQIRSAGYLDICTYKVIAAIFLWLQLYNQFRWNEPIVQGEPFTRRKLGKLD